VKNYRAVIAGLGAILAVACQPVPEKSPEPQSESIPQAAKPVPEAKNGAGVPLAMSGIWQRSGGSLSPVVLTEYGLASSADTGVFDDPNVECRGYSIARSTLSSFQVTKIEVEDDHVVIRYEANAGTRIIFLDGETVSDDSGLNGKSVGRVAGGGVEIISRNFGPEKENAFMAPGVKGAGTVYWMGEDFKMYERFRMVDADTLEFVMIMQDPKILDIPRVIHTEWTRLPDDTLFLQEECVLAEDPFYEEE
jgi:hypothetical protein